MVRYKYRFVKDLCLDDVFFALKGKSIPAYIAYTIDGSKTVRELINTVVWRYMPQRKFRSLRRRVKKALRYKLNERVSEKLEKFGFPIPC